MFQIIRIQQLEILCYKDSVIPQMTLPSTSFGCNISQDLSRVCYDESTESFCITSPTHHWAQPSPKQKKQQIEVEYLLETTISQVSSGQAISHLISCSLKQPPVSQKNTRRQATCHALWPKAMGHRARLLDHPNSPCSHWWCLEDHPRTPSVVHNLWWSILSPLGLVLNGGFVTLWTNTI